MPKSSTFRINGGTLKNIMNPPPPAPPASQQGRMEADVMKYLLKQSKNEALAEVLPKKSSRSRKIKPLAPPPIPKPSAKNSTAPVGSKGIVKEELVSKILKYQGNRRFGNIIKTELGFKYTRNQLTKYKIDDLETILHRIRTHLNTRNMDQVFEHMVKVSADGYEELVSGFGYDIQGFSDLLLSNPAFHDAFERWKIEKKVPDIPPSFQLMYIVASTTYVAHMANAKHIRHDKPEPKQSDIVPIKISKIEKQKEVPTKRGPIKHTPGDIII